MIAKILKYFFGFIGLIIALFFLQHLFWFLYLGYWDSRVRGMCLDDGGAIVYETISLTEEEARELGIGQGSIAFPSEDSARAEGSPYVARINMQTIRDGTPRVVRSETIILRAEGTAPLGTRTTYMRIGTGAILSFDVGSSFSCSDMGEIELDVENKIFRFE